MTPFRVLLVDDEPLARAALRSVLADDAELVVAGEAADGLQAVTAIREIDPDIVFLDVQMPGLDGIGVVSRIGAAAMPVTVFVTAFDSYAVRAFELRALDYVPKPLRTARVLQAAARAKEQVRLGRLDDFARRLHEALEVVSAGAASGEPAAAGYAGRLGVPSDGSILMVPVERIDWIAADDDHVRIHAGPKTYRLRETLRGIERRLDPRRFVRIHRSTLVNVDRIAELEPYFHGDYMVVLDSGVRIRLSRSYRDGVNRVLGLATPS